MSWRGERRTYRRAVKKAVDGMGSSEVPLLGRRAPCLKAQGDIQPNDYVKTKRMEMVSKPGAKGVEMNLDK